MYSPWRMASSVVYQMESIKSSLPLLPPSSPIKILSVPTTVVVRHHSHQIY